MVAVVLASLNERRRELAILRSVGAGPRHIATLVVAESVAATVAGSAIGLALLAVIALFAGPWLESNFGMTIHAWVASTGEWPLLGGVLLAGLLAGAIPAWRACRLALADGLSPRL
jgi:putative ABC transport system permease protein